MAIDPFKQSTAVIIGDPGMALVAQVNRFLKHLGMTEQPLLAGDVSPQVAGYAVSVLQQRLATLLATTADPAILAEATRLSQAAADPSSYVRANRDIITRTIAAYGDSIGLPPATVGITSRQWSTGAWIGALAAAFAGGAAIAVVGHATRR